MPYTKTTWTEGVTPCDKTNMDHLETQFESLTYTELANAGHVAVGASAWEDYDISAVIPVSCKSVDILMMNIDTSNVYSAGVRTNGSALVRVTNISPRGAATMSVKPDANRKIEIWADTTTKIYFCVWGYWC